MKIHGLEKLSLVDYDGKVSATVFTGNCNFKCGFCHNSALVLDCDNLATISENEVLEYLKRRKGLLDGVCISGGEPTLNHDLPSFITKIKDIGVSVKLDTNGTNPKMLKSLCENKLIDYVAMDIKNNKEDYSSVIGLKSYDTKNVEQSVEYLLSGNLPYEFRTTLVAEYHKRDNIVKIGEWIKGANKYFLQKFVGGENCISDGMNEVPLDVAKSYLEIISRNVKHVALRGYDL